MPTPDPTYPPALPLDPVPAAEQVNDWLLTVVFTATATLFTVGAVLFIVGFVLMARRR